MVKWVVAWSDQVRLKVWLASSSEPADWLVVSSAGPQRPGPFMVNWDSSVGTNSVNVDDFAFGPAPILQTLPAPSGTDRNPPDANSGDGGDPVSTFTGSFGYHHTDVAIPGRGLPRT